MIGFYVNMTYISRHTYSNTSSTKQIITRMFMVVKMNIFAASL